MKTQITSIATAFAALVACATAESQSPPTVVGAPQQLASTQPVYFYEQRPIAPPLIITPQQAQSIVDKFKDGYAKLGHPRLLIYVNRELVDETSGLKLTGREEHLERNAPSIIATTSTPDGGSGTGRKNTSGAINQSGDYLYHIDRNSSPIISASAGSPDNAANPNQKPTPPAIHQAGDYRYGSVSTTPPTLADKQTTRDVERLMGRPLRAAGATLVDQRVATQLIPDADIPHFQIQGDSEIARKDRAALAKIADVAIEVLISNHPTTIPGISGDRVVNVPEIQVTAIRLSDSKILGQASASDFLRKAGPAAYNFGPAEITETTSLALMEDMMTGIK